MRHFVIETGGWVLLSLLMSLWLPATGRAVSPIWAPPPLTQLIEEGITQNKEIKKSGRRSGKFERRDPLRRFSG